MADRTMAGARRCRVLDGRMRDALASRQRRIGGLGPGSARCRRSSPGCAGTRPAGVPGWPLPTRRDVPATAISPGATSATRHGGSWDGSTGSPAGTTSTEASCAAKSSGRAIPPRPCAPSGASTTSPIRSRGSRRRSSKARAMAPDDDRVWLALADLATRSGRFDEAGDWLDALRAGAARRPRRLACPARMGPGRRPARRGRCGRRATCPLRELAPGAGARAASPGWPRGTATARPSARPSRS